MMRFLIIAALVTVTVTAAPAVASAGKKDPAKIVDRVFRKLDADKDDRLSRKEVKGRRGLARHFKKIDANDDGFISRVELQAAIERRRARKGA